MAAPLRLHKHPQLAQYDDPGRWPAFQAQGWWLDPDPLKAAHVHVVPRFPLWAEILSYDTIDIPFTLMAHMLPGKIGLFEGEYVKSVRWGTGEVMTYENGVAISGSHPVMRGDPTGERQWSGVLTLDFRINKDTINNLFLFPKHGWAEVRLFTRTGFDNGDVMDVSWAGGVFSPIDPSQPEKPAAEQGNPGVHWRSSMVVYRDGVPITGEVITEIGDYVPLLPFGVAVEDGSPEPWVTYINAYNYTAPPEPPLAMAHSEMRLDADLHHGVPGTLLDVRVPVPGTRQVLGPLALDPSAMGSGKHSLLVTWVQPFPETNEAAVSVVKFDVEVGPGVAAPPPPSQVAVPNVVGMPADQARALLVASGLTVGSVTEVEGTAGIGQVAAEAPAAGTLVDAGTAVGLTVVRAPVVGGVAEWRSVPVVHMQLFVGGVAQPRFQLCTLDDSATCRELATTPGDDEGMVMP